MPERPFWRWAGQSQIYTFSDYLSRGKHVNSVRNLKASGVYIASAVLVYIASCILGHSASNLQLLPLKQNIAIFASHVSGLD